MDSNIDGIVNCGACNEIIKKFDETGASDETEEYLLVWNYGSKAHMLQSLKTIM